MQTPNKKEVKMSYCRKCMGTGETWDRGASGDGYDDTCGYCGGEGKVPVKSSPIKKINKK